ncbi:MAG: hypothetical protein FWC53_02740 [Firmicutes bacterium]|nr:hypothetical protein [Bacillota bacterium]
MAEYNKKILNNIENHPELLKNYIEKIMKEAKVDGSENKEMILVKELWYILAFWEQIETKLLDHEVLRKNLRIYSENLLKNYPDDSDLLLSLGYMMSVLTYLFIETNSDEEYTSIESKGRNMIEEAYKIKPNAVSEKIMVEMNMENRLQNINTEFIINKLKERIKSSNSYLPENCLFNIYFNEILGKSSE